MQRVSKQILALTAAAVAVCGLGFYWGHRTALHSPSAMLYEVAGQSMAPTMSDGEVWRIEPAPTRFRIGDVVAFRREGRVNVKRVAARSGEEVTTSSDGRLLIDGRRLEDVIADQMSPPNVPPSFVRVAASASDWTAVPDHSDWQVFSYHNPHQAGHATTVMDDYPVNTKTKRILNPVDRLVLRVTPKFPIEATTQKEGSPADDGSPNQVWTVLFFQDDETITTITRKGIARSGRPDSQSDATAKPPSSVSKLLSEKTPIAILMNADERERYQVSVFREIEFRDDRAASKTYPFRPEADQLFVVGDNVPISVDSRRFGPIHRSAVIGVVTRRER